MTNSSRQPAFQRAAADEATLETDDADNGDNGYSTDDFDDLIWREEFLHCRFPTLRFYFQSFFGTTKNREHLQEITHVRRRLDQLSLAYEIRKNSKRTRVWQICEFFNKLRLEFLGIPRWIKESVLSLLEEKIHKYFPESFDLESRAQFLLWVQDVPKKPVTSYFSEEERVALKACRDGNKPSDKELSVWDIIDLLRMSIGEKKNRNGGELVKDLNGANDLLNKMRLAVSMALDVDRKKDQFFKNSFLMSSMVLSLNEFVKDKESEDWAALDFVFKQSEKLTEDIAKTPKGFFAWSALPSALFGPHLGKLRGTSDKVAALESTLTVVQDEILPNFMRQLSALEDIYNRRLIMATKTQASLAGGIATLALFLASEDGREMAHNVMAFPHTVGAFLSNTTELFQ